MPCLGTSCQHGSPLITSLGFLHCKLLFFFPFHTIFGKRIKLHLLEGRKSKNLWTCVKTTTDTNKYLGSYFEAMRISCFPLKLHLLIIVFISKSFLQNYYWCSNGDFLSFSFLLYLLLGLL